MPTYSLGRAAPLCASLPVLSRQASIGRLSAPRRIPAHARPRADYDVAAARGGVVSQLARSFSRRRCIAAMVLLGILTPLTGSGQAAAEYDVKGAFIARFASFIEWPVDTFAEATAPVLVCVAGKSAFDSGLSATINRSHAGGRPLRAQQFSAATRCQILFVAASDQSAFAAILPTLAEGTVTVGEQARFLESGGAIQFRADGSRLQFDINLTVIERGTYRISSKLLMLAGNTASPRRQ